MKKLFYIFISLIVVALIFLATLFYLYRSGRLQAFLANELGKRVAPETTQGGATNLISDALGFGTPKTYLVLFLNNTELRPGGGFIGSYGVIKVTKGEPQILKMEGTEILDNSAEKSLLSPPPAPLKKYLLVSNWYFRDSNWYPDFKMSAVKSLEIYRQEKGLESNKIDAVIAFTPTVLEEILKITGPVKVGAIEFNSQNFTEKLEYEVEYGYDKRGIDFSERKQMIKDLSVVLLPKIKRDLLFNWQKYYSLFKQMIGEKQVMLFSEQTGIQKFLTDNGFSAEMKKTNGDYVLWTDANLGSLKSDLAIERKLSYDLSPSSSKWLGKVNMIYQHNGGFDWRTTRYRTYARLYVPLGSVLVTSTGAMETDRSKKRGAVDVGIENGFQWFGAFISIEPGKKNILSFEYYLPENVGKLISENDYSLLIQKQLGSISPKLTLNLNFDKKIVTSSPSGVEQTAIGRYVVETDLRIDKEFNLKF